jgi:chemotaxis family two-component system sensor kinase Cph1
VTAGPAFGQADLSNCEREQIHLAGSIQSHGVLLVLGAPDGPIEQASANAGALLGTDAQALLGRPLAVLGGTLAARLAAAAAAIDDAEPVPLRASTAAGGRERAFDGVAHRLPGGPLVVELEPADTGRDGRRDSTVPPDGRPLVEHVAAAVRAFGLASSVDVLADAAASAFRDMTGYDRVMVYRFDPDGHGQIVAEARDARLESLLGHRYPATDIPQRARELYVRNRVRVLVDVDDPQAPLLPRRRPGGDELDMSMCGLRSMSPLHLQYLRNMGVTATLVVSLVREGRLWGLVAAHHYSPRRLRPAIRAASDLLGEVFSTRLAAIEQYAFAQVALSVRRLEQRLVEATATEGDWRHALLRTPRTLLQPLAASGAALFHDGEILTCGEVPSTPELRALCRWVDERGGDGPFASSSVGREAPSLASMTPLASGVLAVRLSNARPDWLMWFRREQLTSVTWAGDPSKPMVGDDPLELSPRRSFAAWTELVRGTAQPWAPAEIALARSFCGALVDLIVQVDAVRLLIAEHQLAQVRTTVGDSREPVLVADAEGRVTLCNLAARALIGPRADALATLDDVAALFVPPEAVARRLDALRAGQAAWRGELALAREGTPPLPVALRAEAVPGRDGEVLGMLLILADLTDAKRAAAARRHLEATLDDAARSAAGPDLMPREPDPVIGAILNNASLAAMDMADGVGGPAIAPMLEDLEASARRATRLYRRVREAAGAEAPGDGAAGDAGR